LSSVIEHFPARPTQRVQPEPVHVSRNDDESRIRNAIAAARDVAYVWNLDDDSIVWDGSIDSLFGGLHPLPPSGKVWNRVVFADDLAHRNEEIAQLADDETAFDCEYRIHGRDGKLVWVHDCGTVERGTDGKAVRYSGVLRNITRRKQREARLEYLANFDELTGHFNRTRLKQAVDYAIAYSGRYKTPSAYLVVGIDRLSAVSDALGAEASGAVITGVGRVLDRCLRASDVIGRLGGDRFGIVLSNCPEKDISDAAEKILEHVRRAPIETPAGPVHVTVSVGAVAILDQALNTEEAFSRADIALGQAKRAGRDSFACYCDSSEQREARRRSIAIIDEVQAALKTERLVLAYQPIVAALDRHVDHYECLVRLKRNDGSILPAAAFIPVVEESVLMRLIDRRALELAVQELAADRNVKLAINISGFTAADRSWLRAMNSLLRGRPDIARRLIVEITETVALHDIEETARFVSAVRDLGCRIALDDFGAGYSSFRNLKALSVDCVKIDGSFVRGLTNNVDNQLFIRTLLGLADGFGLDTVAECVETIEEATHLVRRGVRYLQGYYFGRPTIERPWLAQQRPVVPALAVESGALLG
jgi:diguanylate cyclase (GGDEF)-like protein/PAS domain S-box-containing protein